MIWVPTGDVEIGNQAHLRIEKDGATLGTQINGVPVDVKIDRSGVRVNPAQTRGRDGEQAGGARGNDAQP